MTEIVPNRKTLEKLLGKKAFAAWQDIIARIRQHYEMDELWGKAGKAGLHELKFRRGGKTLCALYVREGSFGFMVIYGKAEREAFEQQRAQFPESICRRYDESTTYHDGKWIMIDVEAPGLGDALEQMLRVKRRPNRREKQA